MLDAAKPQVLITGAAGEIGKFVAAKLYDTCDVIDMDEVGKSADVPLISADLANDASVARALEQFRTQYGVHIASVIHQAGGGRISPVEQRRLSAEKAAAKSMTIKRVTAFQCGVPL